MSDNLQESWKFKNAFNDRYDTQCEIIHRLIAERLQRCLEKQEGENPADPDSWRISPEEINSLSQAFYTLHKIRYKDDRQ